MIDWTRNLVLPALAAPSGLSHRARLLLGLVGASVGLVALVGFETGYILPGLWAVALLWLLAVVPSPFHRAGLTLSVALHRAHAAQHLIPLDDDGTEGVLVALDDGTGPLTVPVRGGLRKVRAFTVKLDDGRTIAIDDERFALVARMWRSHRLRAGDRVVVWDYRAQGSYRTAPEAHGAREGWIVLRLASHGV